MQKKLLAILSFFLLCHFIALSNADSLRKALLHSKHDTTRGQIYNDLGMAYYMHAPDSARFYWEKSLALSNKNLKTAPKKEINTFLSNKAQSLGSLAFLDHNSGQIDLAVKRYKESAEIFAQLKDTGSSAIILNNTANMLMDEGKLDESFAMFEKAGTYFKQIKNYNGLGMIYQNQALVYKQKGNINAAIDYYNKSLKIRDSIKDTLGLSYAYYELGVIHHLQKDNEKSKIFFRKSVDLKKKVKDMVGYGTALNEIGMVYMDEKNDSCLWYFREGVKYILQGGNFSALGFSYASIGSYYIQKDMYDSAQVNYQLSLDYRLKAKEQKGISLSHYQLGRLFQKKGDLKNALLHTEEAYRIGKEKNYMETINKAAALLSTIYKSKGDYKKALEYFEEYQATGDSLLNKETKRRAIEAEMSFEFDKKVAADSIKAAESKKTLSLQIEKEKTQKYALYGGLALVLLFSGFIFNRFRVTQKQKKIIEIKEQETQKQNEIITYQKHVVEEKQKEILDSINYAQRIQKTLLANDELLNQYLPQHFVLFKPKDIVSGDFYWAAHIAPSDSNSDDLFYIAACDSTGHGVPGAFMSLLNISFLSEAIKEKGITSPASVFDQVRQKLIREINKEGQKDGFDGVLLCIDKQRNKITYAAANNAPVLIRGNSLIEFEADKMPVGIGERTENFSLRSIEFKQGDHLYLYTDGYPDQFGGPKGKKFKYKQLNDILVKIASAELAQQKEILDTTFETWRGELEQVDDVCIIGIRL